MADLLLPAVTGPQERDAARRLEGPIHSERHVRVICVGAGASGLLMAYKLQKHFNNFSLVVYEKNPAVAGTWYENRYPGYVAVAFSPSTVLLVANSVLGAAVLATCLLTTTHGVSSPNWTGLRSIRAPKRSMTTTRTLPGNTACSSTSGSIIRSWGPTGTTSVAATM